MSRQYSIKLCLAILLLIVGFACKKKEHPSDPQKPVSPNQPVVPEIPKSEIKSYLPLILQADREKIEFKYADDGLQLTEIKYATGIREVITYKDNKPKEYRRYLKDDMIYMVDYILNAEGLPVRANQNHAESDGKVLRPTGYYEIDYNAQNNISTITSFDFRNNFISKQQYSYDEHQLLTDISSSELKPSATKYTYDGKSGLLKNVKSAQLFAIENEDILIHNTPSNITVVTNESDPIKNMKADYEYNKDSYPTIITITAGSKKTVYKVTYR
jgi:hypothetical protein